jgi:D-glycero-alpha-D-manno-heptose-7-phosphate kinase
VSTPKIEAAIEAAAAAGAWAGKACGAGGGGCAVFLVPAARHDAVVLVLDGLPNGSVLPVRVQNQGLTVSA